MPRDAMSFSDRTDPQIRAMEKQINDLFFVGYQAKGTPGRAIVEGRTPAKAAIHRLSGYSAHADQQTLCDWVKSMPVPVDENYPGNRKN